ncbi:MAG: hypothetical protein H0U85_03800 [Gemmatimonadales bacterium]|nr:hypothetical protein [Gemmatimonadales bacterium]
MRSGRTIAIIMLAAELGACTSWGQPRAGTTEPQPLTRVQVWQRGRAVELDLATVSQDSIVGTAAAIWPARGARTAIARAGVDSVRVRRSDGGKTVGAVLGTLLVGAATTFGLLRAAFNE